MSDSETRDAFEPIDQRDDEGADVEGHSLESREHVDSRENRDATEEPPDVEGHAFDAPAAPRDAPRDA